MDYTTNQFDDDVNVRLNEPVDTDEGLIQKEGTNAEMINVQQGNENPEITLNQVIEDAHVTLSTVTKKTEVPMHKLVTTLEKEVDELKKDEPFNTQVIALVDEHLDSRLGATRDEFMNYLSASITTRITEQCNIQLPQILPKEVSNFAPPEIKRMVTESLEHAVLAKESSQPKSTYEAAALLTKLELKKILIDKMDESQSYLTDAEHRECYDGLIKSYDLDKSLFSTYDKVKSVYAEEPEFEVADSDMPQDQEENQGNDDEEPKRKIASKREWVTKSKQHEEPTDPD
ncbi:hypothetical protein Tco_0091089 [Tanacetum coccineum]